MTPHIAWGRSAAVNPGVSPRTVFSAVCSLLCGLFLAISLARPPQQSQRPPAVDIRLWLQPLYRLLLLVVGTQPNLLHIASLHRESSKHQKPETTIGSHCHYHPGPPTRGSTILDVTPAAQHTGQTLLNQVASLRLSTPRLPLDSLSSLSLCPLAPLPASTLPTRSVSVHVAHS